MISLCLYAAAVYNRLDESTNAEVENCSVIATRAEAAKPDSRAIKSRKREKTETVHKSRAPYHGSIRPHQHGRNVSFLLPRTSRGNTLLRAGVVVAGFAHVGQAGFLYSFDELFQLF